MTKWTAEDIPDLSGKVIIVTGANSGLGYASTLALARKGGMLVLACRSLQRGRDALAAVCEAVPQAQAGFMQLDLASLASIEAFAATFNERFGRLDILLNNAGLSAMPRMETEDGFEMHFGVNHLGHFALTGQLLDRLLTTPESRVVTVSSRMHRKSNMAWDDLMSKRAYDKWDAYRQSKLANLLFAFELQRRLEAADATTQSLAAHPGFSDTAWSSDLSGLQVTFLGLMSRLFGQSADAGAWAQLYAAADPAARGGGFYGPKGDFRGHPTEAQASAAAYSAADAGRLWDLSVELTGVDFGVLASAATVTG
jgi:NAD(P)-dependent dehydrogenase (short-subunit alcohol dehydrogenase family)